MKAIELFTGAGGLAIATSKAGFHHEALVEYDQYCCDTVNENIERGSPSVFAWPPMESTDVQGFNFSPYEGNVDLLAGGPPCQPFSLGGKHKAFLDKRDMFPEAVRAVRETQPRAVVLENVKGLMRPRYANYLEYLSLQLTYPSLSAKPGEDMKAHLSRLEQHHTSGASPEYRVVYQCLNAANYGVPQKRERVFFVAFREDVHANWSFATHVKTTHSLERLLFDQWVTGDYWKRHGLNMPRKPPERVRSRVEQICCWSDEPTESAWITVRDALRDLPDPRDARSNTIANHQFMPGARTYKGHTGSPLDEPAKTIKAGVHGVPGGENMLRHPNGRVRYFTVRETARLQCFPDDYVFHGSWSETMRQLGNAVPVRLGESVLTSVAKHLSSL
jgi:DNA (cytosine-5)-methyltransferase 1